MLRVIVIPIAIDQFQVVMCFRSCGLRSPTNTGMLMRTERFVQTCQIKTLVVCRTFSSRVAVVRQLVEVEVVVVVHCCSRSTCCCRCRYRYRRKWAASTLHYTINITGYDTTRTLTPFSIQAHSQLKIWESSIPLPPLSSFPFSSLPLLSMPLPSHPSPSTLRSRTP